MVMVDHDMMDLTPNLTQNKTVHYAQTIEVIAIQQGSDSR